MDLVSEHGDQTEQRDRLSKMAIEAVSAKPGHAGTVSPKTRTCALVHAR